MASDADTETFVITRTFDAPRQRVWDAWTKPDELARWFGPKGVTTTVKTHELKAGGILHARMDTPDGGHMWAKFVYRAVEPPTRLAWAHSFSDEQANVARGPIFDGNWPLVLLTNVTFAETDGGTRVTLTWTPLDATQTERATFAANLSSMNQGWSGSFDQLAAFLGCA